MQEEQKESETKQKKSVYKALPNFIPKLVGGESRILNPAKILKILKYIPPMYRLRDLNLAYSNTIHGTSMTTL